MGMGIATCCMRTRMKEEEKEKEKETKCVWYFSNGTVVHGANSVQACRRKMFNTTRGNSITYWANQISDGIYEIQFTPEVFPDVTVLVSACNGNEAAKIARCSLASDYGCPIVMSVSYTRK